MAVFPPMMLSLGFRIRIKDWTVSITKQKTTLAHFVVEFQGVTDSPHAGQFASVVNSDLDDPCLLVA